MTKKAILTLIILIVGALGFLKLNNDFLMLWNSNKINIQAQKPLTNKKVKIEFGISVNTINRRNDLDLFSNRNKYLVIYNGEKENQIVNDYGENDFLITYDNKYYLSFRQFKFNRRHQHIYNFELIEKMNDIYVKVNIEGQDRMKFEKKMLLIKDAEKYVCNTPTGNISGVYNMIELKKK